MIGVNAELIALAERGFRLIRLVVTRCLRHKRAV